MPLERLMAKSWRPATPWDESLSLPGHLKDVRQAAERVLTATGKDQLRALGLLLDPYLERFQRIVLLAAAVHDLGKANDHFQGMILGTRNVQTNPQGLRHEWVTLLMLRQLRDWLLPALGGSALDMDILEWAVAGHHPAHDHASPPKKRPDGGGLTMRFYTGHQDFRAVLDWLGGEFHLGQESHRPCPLAAPEVERSLCDPDSVFGEIASWHRSARATWERLRRSPEARLVAAVKHCLIAADVAGSALPRAIPKVSDRWDWITAAFAEAPQPGDLDAVVNLRLERSREQGGSDQDAVARKQFQDAVAASRDRVTYVKAGCGSGKTLAAYRWAAANHPTRRLYFCYPTTGTATEGFRDYLFEPDGELGNIGARLFHSRSHIDAEIILTTGNDTTSGETDLVTRLESLEAWSTPIVACTVDAVLGVVRNNRRGMFAWPALAQAAFVFDEIHAYDDRLFGALLRFLRDVPGCPALLMTASLPAHREQGLRNLLGPLTAIAGPMDLERRPRYQKRPSTTDPMTLVRDTLTAGGKVLWVCNTVGRVMEAAERTQDWSPLLYHSRFKYEDRVQRHKDVIDAFKQPRKRALALCSQVAEMSLDLSADLLVTDLAPVPALIQRLGRLNRRAVAGGPTKPFVIVEPDGPLPYMAAELQAARDWLHRLAEDGICQMDLATAWKQTGEEPPTIGGSEWLDGGPVTTVGSLREESIGITVLMEADRARVQADRRQLGRVLLPMPNPRKSLNWKQWPRERGLPVAPKAAITYNRMRGAQWAE